MKGSCTCLDLKCDNKNCSSGLSMNFQVHAQFTSAITKIVTSLQRTIPV